MNQHISWIEAFAEILFLENCAGFMKTTGLSQYVSAFIDFCFRIFILFQNHPFSFPLKPTHLHQESSYFHNVRRI